MRITKIGLIDGLINFAVGMVIEQINRKQVSDLKTAQQAIIEGRNLFYINIQLLIMPYLGFILYSLLSILYQK